MKTDYCLLMFYQLFRKSNMNIQGKTFNILSLLHENRTVGLHIKTTRQ